MLASVVLFGCRQPEVTFSEPQPDGVSEKTEIASRFEGDFENPADSALLQIRKQRITLTSFVKESMKIADIDSTKRLSGNRLVDLLTNESVAVVQRNDSIFWRYAYVDTLYDAARKDVLKKFKGFYFANRYYDGLGWQVKKLELHKDYVAVAEIAGRDDFKKLRPLATNRADSLPLHQLKATRRQFRKLVKDNGFSAEAVYLRKMHQQ